MANIETTTNTKPLVQITLPKNEEFNDVISTATLTSSTLEKKIAEFLGATFEDFEGCKIVPQGAPGQPSELKVKAYFKPCMSKVDNLLYAVKVRGEEAKVKGKNVGLSQVVNMVNQLSAAKQFDLEDIAKELLAEFLIIPDANIVDRFNEDLGKVVKVRLPKSWNAFTEEITDVVGATRFQTPYLVVTLDLRLIVAKLYGKKDEAEVKAFAARGAVPRDRYQYDVQIVKVINPTIKSFVLEVRRIDTKAMDALSQAMGYGMVTGNIVMTKK